MLRCMKLPQLGAAVSSIAIQCIGCGRSDGLTRVVVKGNVRLGGSPVERGQIRFIPHVDTAGPVTIEEILDGEYSCRTLRWRAGWTTSRRDSGLGSFGSVSHRSRPTDSQAIGPKKYNVDSELVVTLDDSTNPVVKDFDL